MTQGAGLRWRMLVPEFASAHVTLLLHALHDTSGNLAEVGKLPRQRVSRCGASLTNPRGLYRPAIPGTISFNDRLFGWKHIETMGCLSCKKRVPSTPMQEEGSGNGKSTEGTEVTKQGMKEDFQEKQRLGFMKVGEAVGRREVQGHAFVAKGLGLIVKEAEDKGSLRGRFHG